MTINKLFGGIFLAIALFIFTWNWHTLTSCCFVFCGMMAYWCAIDSIEIQSAGGRKMSTKVAYVLRAALAAFGPNGENWTQGYKARPQGPGPFEPPFCCIGTAFNRLTGTAMASKESGLQALERVLGVKSPTGIIEWNDVTGRTFAEVKELFEKAIAAESAGGK